MNRYFLLAASAAAVLFAGSLGAQMVVGAGSTVDLGNGTLDVGCISVEIAGTMNVNLGTAKAINGLQIDNGGTLTGLAGSSLTYTPPLAIQSGGVNSDAGSVVVATSCNGGPWSYTVKSRKTHGAAGTFDLNIL